MGTTVSVTMPGGVLPNMGYIGMCSPKGYGLLAVCYTNGDK